MASTSAGFLVAWREAHQNEHTLRLSTLTPTGGLSLPDSTALAACAGATATSDVSLAFAGDQGELATGLPNCGEGAGMFLARVNPDGKLVESGEIWDPAFQWLSIDRQGLAPSQAVTGWELVRTVGASTTLAQSVLVAGSNLASDAIEYPMGKAEFAYVQVAAHPDERAFQAPTGDKTRMFVDSNGAPGPSSTYDVLPASSSAAVEAWSYRSIGVVASGDSIRWAGVTSVTLIASGELPLQGGLLHDVRRVHVAQQNGAVYFVATAPGTVYLAIANHVEEFWLNGVPDKEGNLDPSAVPALTTLGGRKSGMALGPKGQVAVVWLSDATPVTDVPLGGWMILDCG